MFKNVQGENELAAFLYNSAFLPSSPVRSGWVRLVYYRRNAVICQILTLLFENGECLDK